MVIDTHMPITLRQYGKVSWQKDRWQKEKLRNRHNPDFHLFLYVEKGSFKIKIDSKTYYCSAGDFVCVPQGKCYELLDSEGTIYCFFQLKAFDSYPKGTEKTKVFSETYVMPWQHPDGEEKIESYNFFHFNHECSPYINIEPVTHCLDNIAVQKIIQRLMSLNIQANSHNFLLAESFFRELLVIVSTEINEKRFSKTVNSILEYINRNYAKPLSLKDISEHFSISESYIARIFRKNLDTTPSEYINMIRIQAACSLLINTDYKISEIAYETGFNTPYYFSRVFRKIQGCTPGEYRKS